MATAIKMSLAKHDYTISHSTSMPDGAVELLESTEFGTDGLRYLRLNVAEQLECLHTPVIFSARSQGELVGMYVLDKRVLQVGAVQATGYYRGALAVKTQWQGRGLGRRLAEAGMQWMEARRPEARRPEAQRPNTAVFSYGCIDAGNSRSLKLLASQGATPIGSLCMFMMYRQWLRQPVELTTSSDDEWHNSELVHAVYGEHGLRDITPSSQDCLSLQDEHGTIISACVSVSAFRIVSMGKAARWATRLLVAPWPPARTRFNPQHFRYVSFSRVLIRPGHEKHWRDFVSSVLSRYQCHFGALYVDPGSRLYSTLRHIQGVTGSFYKPSASIHVIGRGKLPEPAVKTGHLPDQQPTIIWPVDA